MFVTFCLFQRKTLEKLCFVVPRQKMKLLLFPSSYPKQPLIIPHSSSTSTTKLVYPSSSLNLSLEIQQPPSLRTPNKKLLQHKRLTSQTKYIPRSTSTSTTRDIIRIMVSLRLPIPPDMFTSLIRECTVKKDSNGALELYSYIINNTTNLKPTLLLLNRLLLLHASCGQLYAARQLFDQMSLRDFNSWAIMIIAYIDTADYQESIDLFVQMMKQQQKQGLVFPSWIIVCILKACVCTMNMGLGKQVHALLFKLGTSNNISLMGSLINFYGQFRCLEDANFVFNQLSRHNTVVWTAKIVNNCREGHFYDVFDDFKEMAREGVKKNSFTVSTVLKACARMDDGGNCGQQVHANAVKLGLDWDVYVQCGLVDMYGKQGLLSDAERMFAIMGNKENVAPWNAMLVGYLRNGFCVEAVKFMYQMKAAGIEVQESLINDVRIACGEM